MRYEIKGPDGSGIIYIEDTKEYKIIVDAGDAIYVFDTPANSTIYQLTDLQEIAGQSEQQVRASAGIYVTDNDTFMSGFFNDDRLVSVAIDVNQITPAIADDAQDILKTFFDAQESLNKTYGARNALWKDEEYLAQIAILTQQLDGDMDAAVTYFANTEEYGNILKRLPNSQGGIGISQDEIDAEEMIKTDFVGFQNLKKENIAYINGLVAKSGGDIPPTGVEYLADLMTKGIMSQQEVIRQVSGATDDYSPYKDTLNAGFLDAIAGKGTKTNAGMDGVQELLNKYLPSYLHDTFDIAAEAGKIRNDPNYQSVFEDTLKDQRFALYPMYDKNVNWNFIVASKKQVAKNVLGVELKENDPALDSIIRMNDTSKEQEYLRNIGLERDYQKTKNDLQKAMMGAFGSGVVSSTAYVEGR